MSDLEEMIKRAASAISDADALMINAGAGMGVDSGLPDFRGNEGFWKAYPPIARLGIAFSDMANPRWFDSDPELAWAFYGHRLNLYRATTPHKGFYRLRDMAEKKENGYFIFTSNVDGQFQKAGFEADRINECHGSIHHLQCARPCGDAIWEADGVDVRVDETAFRAAPPLPACTSCGGLARPNILMFGDWHWISHRTNRQEGRLSRWLETLREKGKRLAIIETGAGSAVPTVRMQSEQIARVFSGTLIRINPRDHDVPPGQISLPLGSKEGIERIFDYL